MCLSQRRSLSKKPQKPHICEEFLANMQSVRPKSVSDNLIHLLHRAFHHGHERMQVSLLHLSHQKNWASCFKHDSKIIMHLIIRQCAHTERKSKCAEFCCPQVGVCLRVSREHDYCHYNSGQVIRLDPHQLCLACQPRSCAKCLVLPDSPLVG